MGLFSNCIFACDIDGTLLINGYISPRNIEKIEFFMREGGCFSLSTGRTVGAVSPVFDYIKRVSPSVVANGSMIYDYENNRILYEECIPKADYRIVKKVLDMGLNVGIEAHAADKILTVFANDETAAHQKYERLVDQKVSYDEACKYNWNKVVYLFDNPDDLSAVKKMIAAEETDSAFVDTSTTLYDKKRNYYEQTPTGVSKSTALDILCGMLNIKDGGKYAMGDYYNDLEMIKKADISAVPLEAPDDVKSCADFVAGPCKDGAVADFIDYLCQKSI